MNRDKFLRPTPIDLNLPAEFRQSDPQGDEERGGFHQSGPFSRVAYQDRSYYPDPRQQYFPDNRQGGYRQSGPQYDGPPPHTQYPQQQHQYDNSFRGGRGGYRGRGRGGGGRNQGGGNGGPRQNQNQEQGQNQQSHQQNKQQGN